MSRVNFVIETLQSKGEVSFKPHGNSMTPKINSGDLVKVKFVLPNVYRVGDIVYCKVKGSYLLHMISSIDNGRFVISNNHGHINGTVSDSAMFGLCIEVCGAPIISSEELHKRFLENK